MFKYLFILCAAACTPAWGQLVCTFDADGHCEEPETAADLIEPAASRYGQWGAIVAGLSNGDPSNGIPARVATGAAAGRTQDEAIAKAKAACNERTVGYSCRLIKVFSDGCWYVANGTRTTQARYAAGSSWEDAMANCQSGGFTCKTKPVGVCVGNDIEEGELDD